MGNHASVSGSFLDEEEYQSNQNPKPRSPIMKPRKSFETISNYFSVSPKNEVTTSETTLPSERINTSTTIEVENHNLSNFLPPNDHTRPSMSLPPLFSPSALSNTSINSNTKTNRRVEEMYEVSTQHLGRGHYAVVYQGKCKKTGRLVAIKKIKRFLTDEKRLRAEIAVLRKVKKHANIVELIEVFETPREVHLVMELCTGGELFERLADKGPYSEADCGRHIKDMANAVAYLHDNGIIHRDLKPENILLSTPNDEDAIIKVADFGLARIFTASAAGGAAAVGVYGIKTKCGTWGYSAPEMISGSGTSFGYDFKVDSWSLGTILYILLCGYHPFDPHGTTSDNEMISCIKKCQFDFEDEAWIGISEGAKDLIRKLLVLDPTKRWSIQQVLTHPWITGNDITEMPLSPTIHQDLARYRENAKKKETGFYHSYEVEEEVNDYRSHVE